MKILLSTVIPSWVRILTITALVTVTLFLVSAKFSESVLTSGAVLLSPQRVIELQNKEKTLDLAIEFGFDPLVVQLTRKLAEDAMKANACICPMWRFVNSEQELSYLVLSIIQMESRGDYRALNQGGPAYGLTQLVLSTARHYDKSVRPDDLLTIPRNLTIAMQHFVDLLKRFDGNPHAAVLAWNKGAGAVSRSMAIGSSPDASYARLVLTQAAMRNAQ